MYNSHFSQSSASVRRVASVLESASYCVDDAINDDPFLDYGYFDDGSPCPRGQAELRVLLERLRHLRERCELLEGCVSYAIHK